MKKQEDQDQQKMSQNDANKEGMVQGENVVTTDAGETKSDDVVEKDPIQKLEDEKAELEAKNKELHNQYLMAMADFDNYRKRMIKEKQEAFDYANANLLTDLLESIDNFDRALDAAATAIFLSITFTPVGRVEDGHSRHLPHTLPRRRQEQAEL